MPTLIQLAISELSLVYWFPPDVLSMSYICQRGCGSAKLVSLSGAILAVQEAASVILVRMQPALASYYTPGCGHVSGAVLLTTLLGGAM